MISIKQQRKRHRDEYETTGITVPLIWRMKDFRRLEDFIKGKPTPANVVNPLSYRGRGRPRNRDYTPAP